MKILALLFVMTAAAQARIGETKDQLVKRYGTAEATGEDTFSFVKDGIRIMAVIWNGKCHLILFTPTTEGEAPRTAKFTAQETETLLSKNPERAQWEKVDDQLRRSADGKFIATASPDSILIQSVEFRDAQKRKPKPAPAPLEDF